MQDLVQSSIVCITARQYNFAFYKFWGHGPRPENSTGAGASRLSICSTGTGACLFPPELSCTHLLNYIPCQRIHLLLPAWCRNP